MIDDEIPEGWLIGNGKQSKEQCEFKSKYFKDLIWIHNDNLKIRRRIKRNELVPVDWKLGWKFNNE